MSILVPVLCFGQLADKNWYGFETSVTGDFIGNVSGGIHTGFAYIGMEELALSIDIESAGLWKGGSLFLQGINAHGISPSQELNGDLQVSSNIEAGDYVGFYQYYYQQSLGNLSFLVGQHDLNSEFVGTEFGGTFINSSFGISPTMSLNFPVSIYPLAALSFIAKYELENRYAIKLGIYDGDPGDPESNRYNMQPNLSSEEGLLLIGEWESNRLVNDLPESHKVGGYYHSSSFTDYSDTLQLHKGNYGFYTIHDFVLWSGFNHPDSYLGLFAQGAWAPSKINQVDYYLGAGLHLNGILPVRYNDAVGLAFAYANISKVFSRTSGKGLPGETAIELTYKIQVFDAYTIQPNLQYIINPGVDTDTPNVLIALIRFTISLEN